MTSRYQVYSTNLNDGTELIWKTKESIHISDDPLSISQNNEGVEGQREIHSIIDIKGTTDKHSAAGYKKAYSAWDSQGWWGCFHVKQNGIMFQATPIN